MMQIEFPKIHQSQQDMELIDILWRQDIDLGAGREVFDDSHRQKEHERRRRRELEEEEQRQRLRDQEKVLLSQLQLDEETGEFVPRPPPTATPPEPTQTVIFTEEDGDALSFDECMLLLEETFPLVEAVESAPLTVDPSISAVPGSGTVAMGPPQAPLPHLLATPPPVQKTVSDMEQVWMELLSIPELQQCLNMQTADDLEPTAYTMASTPPRVQDPPYSFYLPKLTDVVVTSTEAVGPPGYHSTTDGPFTAANPPDNLNQMTLEASDLNASFTADSFCDIFYPDLSNINVNGASPLPSNEEGGCPLAGLSDEALAKPKFVPEEGFESERPEMVGELPDSDLSVSLGASPNFSSSEKSLYDDGSMGYSDSDMEDTDSNSGSAETDCTEVFPLTFNPDAAQAPPSAAAQPALTQGEKVKHPKTEPTEGVGHNKPPFTKDKYRRRAESRLSRDEQRAKTLQIPFTVDMIINLPVDDFNEMMSKHQLNEAQLALVRDIRRRGKNKVAAQNCRKRKMESIAGLEYELDSLKEQKERLLMEKLENDSSLRQAKRQLSSLYQEVFSMLRDQEGRPYSPSEYSLQQTSEGNVFLVPRVKKTSHKADAPFSA